MKAYDIYKNTLALLSENHLETRDFEFNAIDLINILLSDCFEINNSIRRYKGYEELKDIISIDQLSDIIDYEHEVCMDIIPYGLASLMILEDDMTRSGFFDFRYQQKKLLYNKMNIVSMKDLYI